MITLMFSRNVVRLDSESKPYYFENCPKAISVTHIVMLM
jgi:hypothetical protein